MGDAGAVAAAASAPGADAMWRVRRCCTLAYAEQMMDLPRRGEWKQSSDRRQDRQVQDVSASEADVDDHTKA